MTVDELIKQLQEFDKEKIVRDYDGIEICDIVEDDDGVYLE